MTTQPSRGKRSGAKSAFTLIELLTVIAIIGILAAILIPVVSKVRSTARRSVCASNLRQIGMGIWMYTNDNQGRLPGGLNEGQGGYYKNEAGGSLVAFIGRYIAASEYKAGTSLKSDFFVCPAWAAQFPDATSGICYAMNMRVSLDGGTTFVEPFGRALNNKKPLRINQITEPLSKVPAMFELDRKNAAPTGLTGQQATWDPVHGSVRNVLYLDASVRAVPVN